RAGLITGAIAVMALLSACGTHPGAAAVVEGKTISVDDVDESATAYCSLSLAQGSQPLSQADARRQALAGLIAWNVAMNLADEKNLHLDSAEWALSEEERQQLEQTFDPADLPVIEDVLKRSHHTAAIQTALGERAARPVLAQVRRGPLPPGAIRTALGGGGSAPAAEAEERGAEPMATHPETAQLAIDRRFGAVEASTRLPPRARYRFRPPVKTK